MAVEAFQVLFKTFKQNAPDVIQIIMERCAQAQASNDTHSTIIKDLQEIYGIYVNTAISEFVISDDHSTDNLLSNLSGCTI